MRIADSWLSIPERTGVIVPGTYDLTDVVEGTASSSPQKHTIQSTVVISEEAGKLVFQFAEVRGGGTWRSTIPLGVPGTFSVPLCGVGQLYSNNYVATEDTITFYTPGHSAFGGVASTYTRRR